MSIDRVDGARGTKFVVEPPLGGSAVENVSALRGNFMWVLYQGVVVVVLLFAAPFFLLRRWGHYRPTLAGRLGVSKDFEEQTEAHSLWIHAVSVGEVEVAKTLLEELERRHPGVSVVVTTVTPTGQERARRSLPNRIRKAYLPFELGWSQRRFLRRYEPQSLILVEGELWPLLLRRMSRRQAPVVMVNGRFSDRSFPRLRRLRPWLGPLLGPIEHFGVQTEQDRDRLLALGVEARRVTVTGNIKFDRTDPVPLPALEQAVRALARGRPILVAGSTMKDEDEIVLDAFASLADLDPVLVLAPRHPERFEEVYRLCVQRGLVTRRRSELEDRTGEEPETPNHSVQPTFAVLLLDSLGELAPAYSWAKAAFVGGTLVSTGGHNPIEPAQAGAPVCVGPSMENFREIATQFDQHRAWQRVHSSTELATTWRRWIEDEELGAEVAQRARELVLSSRGALVRTADLINDHLSTVLSRTNEQSGSS